MRNSAFKSLVLVSVTLMTVLGLSACAGEATSSASSEATAEAGSDEASTSATDTDASSAETEEGIAFPYKADEGKLVINSVFPSDIENPDFKWEYADGVASIEFENVSGEYLQSVTFYVTMTDGSVKTFSATDVPADATDWAFETGNQTVDLQQAVKDISYDTRYGNNENSVMDLVTVDINDLVVTITNSSNEELTNLNVVCHADMGDAMFGGTAYRYNIDYLGAGETTAVDAADCLLGVKVVDITRE